MTINNISVVIIAKNAQSTIKECLNALKPFDEVILYLNDSSDNTENIASTFVNVKIIKGTFIGFGPTKNEAAKYAKNEWILSLDSDEILNNNLLKEIKDQDFSNKNNLFILKRDNYFLGQKTKSYDFIVRIYNKNSTKFNDNIVHEKIIVSKKHNTITLKESFKHLNITDINQTLTKMIKYTDLGAKDKKSCYFITVILKPLYAFIRTYFFKLYFTNGWVGFTMAINSANRRFYRYLKQYINCLNSKSSNN